MRRLLAAICIATGFFTFGVTAPGGVALADVGNGNSGNAHSVSTEATCSFRPTWDSRLQARMSA